MLFFQIADQPENLAFASGYEGFHIAAPLLRRGSKAIVRFSSSGSEGTLLRSLRIDAVAAEPRSIYVRMHPARLGSNSFSAGLSSVVDLEDATAELVISDEYSLEERNFAE